MDASSPMRFSPSSCKIIKSPWKLQLCVNVITTEDSEDKLQIDDNKYI